MEQSEAPHRKTGRPLSFDREAALYRAMLLFWAHGYEGTSLNDLTAAMGVTPPSIYNVFGDKKALFREAVKLYLSGPQSVEELIKGAKTARDAADGLMRSAAIGFTGKSTPSGCLLATSAISCSDTAADLQAELAGIRSGIETCLRARIQAAVKAGEVPNSMDPRALAGFAMAIIQGMSTLARDGASQKQLLSIVDLAMTIWPPISVRTRPDT